MSMATACVRAYVRNDYAYVQGLPFRIMRMRIRGFKFLLALHISQSQASDDHQKHLERCGQRERERRATETPEGKEIRGNFLNERDRERRQARRMAETLARGQEKLRCTSLQFC